jgi:hypothetical protein
MVTVLVLIRVTILQTGAKPLKCYGLELRTSGLVL